MQKKLTTYVLSDKIFFIFNNDSLAVLGMLDKEPLSNVSGYLLLVFFYQFSQN